MDDLARFNRARWNELADVGIGFSRPWLDLTADEARRRVDPEGLMDDPAGRKVLCLAGGGGQQSAAFALLGAEVTVVDLSDVQLSRDREAAEYYGLTIHTVQADMRDLSCLRPGCFDHVWHAHSLSFVPSASQVLAEVARVIRKGGRYRLSYTNPFCHGMWEDTWNGRGYVLSLRYEDGPAQDDSPWRFTDPEGQARSAPGPREFRHRLSTVINGLVACGFRILGLFEDTGSAVGPEPGSWEHFMTVAAPWITLWAQREG